MNFSVTQHRNFRHGFVALTLLTLPIIAADAYHRKPAAPSKPRIKQTRSTAKLHKTQQHSITPKSVPLAVDMNSVSSMQRRVKQLADAAKLRKAEVGAKDKHEEDEDDKPVKVYVPSFDGSKKQITLKKHEIPGTDWAGAQLFYLQQRAFPFDRLNLNAYTRAAEQRDKMLDAIPQLKAQRTPAKVQQNQKIKVNGANGIGIEPPIVSDQDEQTSSLRWEKMGPGGYEDPIYGQSSWRIGGLEYDPYDPNTLYAATPKGGIWRTNDSGASWTPLTDKEFGLSFSSVAVSPFDNNVIFAGSGDYDGGNGPGFGILKSTDYGETWTNYGKVELGTAPIRRIMPHPFWSNIVFATAGKAGIFRSIDEGETWTKVMDAGVGSVSNITFNSNYSRLYASVDGVGIFFSTDDGQTWAVMPGAPTGAGRFDVATSKLGSKRKTKTLYVLHAGAGASGNGTVSKGEPPIDNVDGDIAFTALNDAPKDTFGGRPIWDQQGYNFFIGTSYALDVLDPGLATLPPPFNRPYTVDQDVIFIGLLDVWMSQNSGVLWQYVRTRHTDQHSITINPYDSNEVLLGSDAGVRKIHFTATDEDFHTAQPMPSAIMGRPPTPVWSPFRNYTLTNLTFHNKGLDIAQFYDSGFSPLNANEGLGGTQDNGSQHTTDLEWRRVSAGDGGGCGINTANPLIQYSSSQVQNAPDTYPINVTFDGWQSGSFDISLYTNGDISPFVANGTINAGNPSKFMFATNFLYEFDSDTFSWRKFRQKFSNTGYIIGVDAAPSDANYIYVGTSDGLCYYTFNGGKSFTRIDGQGKGGLPQRSITDIVVSKTNPKQIFVTVSGTGTPHVYRCEDATKANPRWTSISNGLPDIYTNAIEILPRNNGKEMFVGTDIGVFYTDNGGQNWYNATRTMGLPNVDVRDIQYMDATGYLHISTFGRGMWRLPIGDSAVGAGRILFRAQTNLDSYRGDKSQLTAVVEFLSGNAVVKTANVRLTAAGYIIAPIELAGRFDIRVTIPGFLKRRINGIYVGEPNQPAFEMTFVNGDVNKDNSITDADWRQVQPLLNRNSTGIEDVDGDRRITINDIRIIQRNLGKVGDN